MLLDTQYNLYNKTFTLNIMGDFCFNTYPFFVEAIGLISSRMESIIIDLQSTSAIDSAALGMLSVLLDKANYYHQKVTIINARPEVYIALKLSKFDTIVIIKPIPLNQECCKFGYLNA